MGPPPHTVRNIGEAPRLGQPLSIERPEKGGLEEQESLVDRPGNGKEADPGEPAEGARDSPVAGEEPDGADCALCASHEGLRDRVARAGTASAYRTRPPPLRRLPGRHGRRLIDDSGLERVDVD